MNIWKSYIWTTDRDVNMKVIFAVMSTTWAVVNINPEKNSGLNFTTARVVFITAKITFIFTSTDSNSHPKIFAIDAEINELKSFIWATQSRCCSLYRNDYLRQWLEVEISIADHEPLIRCLVVKYNQLIWEKYALLFNMMDWDK